MNIHSKAMDRTLDWTKILDRINGCFLAVHTFLCWNETVLLYFLLFCSWFVVNSVVYFRFGHRWVFSFEFLLLFIIYLFIQLLRIYTVSSVHFNVSSLLIIWLAFLNCLFFVSHFKHTHFYYSIDYLQPDHWTFPLF